MKTTKKQSTAVMVPASEEALAQLRQEYPVEIGFNRALLPRFGLVSQDQTEGKGKNMKVVTEAGTFFIEVQSEEEEEYQDAEGKTQKRKSWERTELGTETEGIILFQRKQLKYYDESTEKYTSSPVYDTDDEVIPLFLDKKEIERGTPAQLKALYPGTHKVTGKAISLLEDNRILYVLIDETVYQLNLRGSSMYSFLTWSRKVLPPSLLTKFSSEAKEKGSIVWNQMTFEAVRGLSQDEINVVLEKVGEIKQGIAAEKQYYANQAAASDKADGESDEDAAARKEANRRF